MKRNPDVYWLALRRVGGVGPRVARLLLDAFHSAEKVFEVSEDELIAAGIFRNTARNIITFADFETLEKELCEFARLEVQLVRWTDASYPPNLKHIPDPPPCFYLRGTPKDDERDCVAVVGARSASDAGRRMAYRIGTELAAKGITVVSGLARGIDSEAHQGAVDAGGRTIAVLGNGIDSVYPAENRKLAESILEKGALITELPLGTPPMAENFPGRNRILSGLCLGVVIVEAAEKSGSLITARLALEQDRQVFAVPGSPLTGKSRGSNRLLKDGAILVECVEDVLEELAPQLARTVIQVPENKGRSSGQKVGSALDNEALAGFEGLLKSLKPDERLHVDTIIEASGLGAQMVLGMLLELELKGIVTQYPGKLFSLSAA